jgi:hypothetical protein
MISDNDLLLYHYGDGLDIAERDRIRAALRTQPELEARLESLVEQLDAATMLPDAAVPADIQNRWRTTLERAARNEKALARESRHAAVSPARWSVVAAAAAIVLIIAGVRFSLNSTQERVRESPVLVRVAEPSRLDHGMRWHLASAERQLAELSDASDEERRDLIDSVIAQNRLYAAAAERAGDERLARALRAFTPILESLAEEGPDEGEPGGEIAQLNFELRVMQARLAADASTSPTPDSLAL